jgi:hypothetical protein
MTLIKAIRKDPKYKTLKQVLENAQSKIDIEQSRKRAFVLHASLEVRGLYGRKKFSPKRILSATAQIQANRSTLVEIRARLSEHVSYVEAAQAAFRRHVFSEFSEDLRDYRTKEQRDAFINNATVTVVDFISEVTALVDLLDTFIKDLDQAGHNIRHMVDVLKLLASSKGGQVI